MKQHLLGNFVVLFRLSSCQSENSLIEASIDNNYFGKSRKLGKSSNLWQIAGLQNF